MNINNKTVAKLSFKGIQGTSVKVKEDGSRENYNIDFQKDDARLIIDRGNSHDNIPTGQNRLMISELHNNRRLYGKEKSYNEDINIKKVNESSQLTFENANGTFNIDSVSDKAGINIYGYESGNTTHVNIGKVKGKNTELYAVGTGSSYKINGKSQFTLIGTPRQYDIDGDVKKLNFLEKTMQKVKKLFTKANYKEFDGPSFTVKGIDLLIKSKR